ncbi:MAG: hypothetical protein HFJ47_01465 [Clostridia bacterium]|nr:hypothetical protein [Clostridia bacterium]
MDLNEQMKEDNEDYLFSKSQKESIYNKHLIPLKLKISQILLYDSEVASVFLQKYNEITKKEDITTIMKDIVELENEINEYEKSDNGKEKLSEGQSAIINNQLESLLGKCEELDIKDFESKFLDIKEMYMKNSENYSYSDKDSIEQKISSAQARLIMKKCRENILDLHSEISEEDAARLTMAINNETYTLMQSQNPNIQDIVNEIKYKMIDREDAVYDVEIWKLLDSAQRSGERIEQRNNKTNTVQRKNDTQNLEESSQNILLPAIPKQRRNFHFPSLGNLFQRRTLKIGKQRMRLANTVQIGDETVRVQDLANVDMEWLAERIPEEMLNDIENERLIQENNENFKERYIPNRKTPIYDFFDEEIDVNKIFSFCFYNENGSKLVLIMHALKYAIILTDENMMKTTDMKAAVGVSYDTILKIMSTVDYAEFIDETIGSSLSEELENEIGIWFEKIITKKTKIYNNLYDELTPREEQSIDKIPILHNLQISYNRLKIHIDRTESDFRTQENTKRNRFYENNQLKNELKIDSSKQKKLIRLMLQKEDKKEQQSSTELVDNENKEGTSDRGGE